MSSENQQPTAAENFHKQAEVYLAQRKLDEAIASCELAIKIEPTYAPPYKTLGNVLQGKGQLDVAENWYKKAIEVRPNWPEVYANLGSIYAKKQGWQQAVEFFRKAISIKPDFAGAYRNLARVLELAGYHDEAIKSQYQALSLEPEKATDEEHINLGDELIKKRDTSLAISCYKNAIKINAKSARAYQKLGEALKREGKLDEATVCYRRAIELNSISSGETGGDTLMAAGQEGISNTNNAADSKDTLAAAITVDPRDTLAASTSMGNSKGNIGDTLGGVTATNMGITTQDLEALTMLAEAYISQKKWSEAIAAGQQIIRHQADAKAYKIIGNAQQASGKINEAIGSYTKAIEIKPNFPEAYANIGSIFAQQQQWQRAISAYQKAISIKPDFTGAYRNLAKIFGALKKQKEEAECLYEVMRREPESATEKEYLEVGNVLLKNGKAEAAIACYRSAIHLNPNSIQAIYQLGEFLNSQGQFDEAIPYYQKVVAIQESSPGTNQELIAEANRKLTEIYSKLNRTGEAVEYQYQTLLRKPQATAEEYLEMGNRLLANDKFDLAVNCYQNAVKLNPNLTAAKNKLAEVWQQLGRWDEAIAYYQSLVNANPNSAEAYQLLADALVEKGQLDAALQNYQKLKELVPEKQDAGNKLGKVYYLQGEELEKEGKKEEAIAAYRRAVDLNADVDVVYQKLGEILVEKEEWEEAVKVNRKATELNPDFSWSYNNLGNALKALEKWEEAAEAYGRATELNADFPWSQISFGDCLMKLEKWEEAVPVYRRAIELKPDFVWSYVNLGKAFWNLGEWQEAIAPLKEALKLEENIPEAYHLLAEALHKRARLDLDGAIKWYRKAIEASPDNIDLYHKALDVAPEDETLYLQLGDALVRQGKGYLAIGFYQVGLQINPESSEIQAALDKLKTGNPSRPPFGRGETAGTGETVETGETPVLRETPGTGETAETGETPVLRETAETGETPVLRGMPEEGGSPIPNSSSPIYKLWLKANLPTPEKLGEMAEILETFRVKPVIAVVMPVGKNTSEESLRGAMDSIAYQIYPYWELWCVADSVSPKIQSVLDEYAQINSKIKLLPNPQPGNLAAGVNAALSLAGGEFFGLLEVGDTLTRDALYQMAALLNRYPKADAIYADEDRLTDSGEFAEPYFKPDWSPESVMSRMYVGRFCVYRRDLVVNELMGLRGGFEGSEEYDLVLRLSEKSDRIYHVSKVLYHRGIDVGTGETPVLREESGKKALEEAIARRGEPAKVEVVENHPGFYRVRYDIADYKPVSIIIPTRNLGEILDRCLESIFEKTTYPNYEVIVIDNGSDEPATKQVFEKWEKLESQRFQRHELDIPFNFAKLNNFAVEKASGDFLLFLNNDTEVITPDWIEAMVEQAQREAIGAVGPLLLYPDNTVQHAGVVMGLRSVGDHSHRGFKSTDAGYHGQIISVNNYSAVTAACLMCRREVFDAVGGFDEELAVAFNDVDFCLKITHQGYRNVYLPHAVLYHYESKSRGVEDTGEKQLRFQKELQTMKQRWQNAIEEDPYYNRHFTREKDDFSLRVVTDVEASISLYEKDAEIVGFAIDTPKEGTYKNVSSISIGGWIIGKKYPVTTVKLTCGGELLREVAANLPRLDVGQANPQYPYAQHCGFWGEMETIEFPPEANILVEAVLKDGSHVRLGMVKLKCPLLINNYSDY
ncbi:MAG: tetratricopeptide repeat protein [Cyanobacteriota bacterium]|nr:tetratricopeptide repeat protein [Cyanobacteriota bacterium]